MHAHVAATAAAAVQQQLRCRGRDVAVGAGGAGEQDDQGALLRLELRLAALVRLLARLRSANEATNEGDTRSKRQRCDGPEQTTGGRSVG